MYNMFNRVIFNLVSFWQIRVHYINLPEYGLLLFTGNSFEIEYLIVELIHKA